MSDLLVACCDFHRCAIRSYLLDTWVNGREVRGAFFLRSFLRLSLAMERRLRIFGSLLAGAIVLVVTTLISEGMKARRERSRVNELRSSYEQETHLVGERIAGQELTPGIILRSLNYDVATNEQVYEMVMESAPTTSAFQTGVKLAFWKGCGNQSPLFALQGTVVYRFLTEDDAIGGGPTVLEYRFSAQDCPAYCLSAAMNTFGNTKEICRVLSDPDYKATQIAK